MMNILVLASGRFSNEHMLQFIASTDRRVAQGVDGITNHVCLGSVQSEQYQIQ